MIIWRASSLSICFFAASLFAAAQCPKISVSSPTDVQDGQPITFTATVDNLSRDITPTYNWTVSAGTISSGQGTSSITVDTSYAGGQSATATVDVGGLLRRCNSSASATTFIAKRVSSRKIDEYGPIRLGDEKARLDNFAIELQNDPIAKGYVVAYAARGSIPRTAITRLNTAKNYLVNVRGIESGRIVTVNGGTQATAKTELWVVPDGAAPPAASPPVVNRPQTRISPTPSVERPQTPANHNLLGRRAG
jgi:hypothetical protein